MPYAIKYGTAETIGMTYEDWTYKDSAEAASALAEFFIAIDAWFGRYKDEMPRAAVADLMAICAAYRASVEPKADLSDPRMALDEV